MCACCHGWQTKPVQRQLESLRCQYVALFNSDRLRTRTKHWGDLPEGKGIANLCPMAMCENQTRRSFSRKISTCLITTLSQTFLSSFATRPALKSFTWGQSSHICLQNTIAHDLAFLCLEINVSEAYHMKKTGFEINTRKYMWEFSGNNQRKKLSYSVIHRLWRDGAGQRSEYWVVAMWTQLFHEISIVHCDWRTLTDW